MSESVPRHRLICAAIFWSAMTGTLYCDRVDAHKGHHHSVWMATGTYPTGPMQPEHRIEWQAEQTVEKVE